MMWDVTDSPSADTALPAAGRAAGPRAPSLGARVRRAAESWQVVLASGLAVLLAATLVLALAGRDPAAEETFVTSATSAVLRLPDGTERAASVGDRVPRGSTLRTSGPGGARLTTAGRDVWVGALSTVTVLDGVRQVLERGQVLVDTQRGPALTLATTLGAGTVQTTGESLARVEQNVATLRLAVYRGEASVTAASRRASTTVPALFETRVPYDGLPEPVSALALTVRNGVYDQWEQLLVSNLVAADIDLNSVAAGLDGPDGQAVLQAAPASLTSALEPGRTTGEAALAVAVAQKARLFDDDARNLDAVERHRSDGGSWGVVAAIVRAPVTEVTKVLDSSLDAAGPAGSPGFVPDGTVAPPNGSPDGSGLGRPTPTRTPSGPGGPTTPPPTRGPVDDAVDAVKSALPTPAPTVTPTPTTPPTPAPSRSPAPVEDVVGTVIDALLP